MNHKEQVESGRRGGKANTKKQRVARKKAFRFVTTAMRQRNGRKAAKKLGHIYFVALGTWAAHLHWHASRGVTSAKCTICREEFDGTAK